MSGHKERKLDLLESSTSELSDSARLRRIHELLEVVAVTGANALLVTGQNSELSRPQREALLTMYFSCVAVLYGSSGLKTLASALTDGFSDAIYAAREAGVDDTDLDMFLKKKKGDA